MRHDLGGAGSGPQSGGGLPPPERPGDPPQRQPIINAPAIVLWTMAALAITHFLRVVLPIEQSFRVIWDFGFIPARLSGADVPFEGTAILPEPFASLSTFLTHAFVHGDVVHLGFNSVWLLAFGTPVGRRLGTVRFLILYALCAIGGAMLHLLVDPGGTIPVVGASGAISGLMGAAARFMFSQYQASMVGWSGPVTVPLAPLTDQRVLGFAAVWVLINLVFGMVGLDVTGEGQMIAWQAHLGGFFTGLFAISLLDRTRY